MQRMRGLFLVMVRLCRVCGKKTTQKTFKDISSDKSFWSCTNCGTVLEEEL